MVISFVALAVAMLAWLWLRLANPFAVSSYAIGVGLRYVITLALGLAMMFIVSGAYNLVRYFKTKHRAQKGKSAETAPQL